MTKNTRTAMVTAQRRSTEVDFNGQTVPRVPGLLIIAKEKE